MKVLTGLHNDMVLQRDGGNHVDSYFTIEGQGEVTLRLPNEHPRVGCTLHVEELPGSGAVRRFHMTGLPTGGPYTLSLTVAEEEAVFTGIYVGDVWLLAGQSNMEGVGAWADIAAKYAHNPAVRYYSFDGKWLEGEPRLHRLAVTDEPFILDYIGNPQSAGWVDRGVGPGFFFAESMYARTGVPQGLIPCAVGGSHMGQWNPADPDDGDPGLHPNLYGVSIRRVRQCGDHVRGIFWHQGCSQTGPEGCKILTEQMVQMVQAYRRDLHDPSLPFVQGQIHSYVCAGADADEWWSGIREVQRRLHEHIDHMDTVAATNASLEDGIHMSSSYQKQLGTWAAESMYHLCFDPYGVRSTLFPQFDTIFPVPQAPGFGTTLAVRFRNLNGRLISADRPTGFAFTKTTDHIDTRRIVRVELHNDTAFIRHEVPAEDLRQCYLYYGYGNCTYANITDEDGRPLPAMGPIALAPYLE